MKDRSLDNIKDSVETPPNILKSAADKIGIKVSDMYDVCRFNINFDENTDFNGILHDYPGFVNFVNPPWSRGKDFVAWSIIQYLRGRSIILLLPYETAMNKIS